MSILNDQVRTAGPSMVSTGLSRAPTVVVLDPAGEAKRGLLPATWRPLGHHVHVVWWRLPAVARQNVSRRELAREFDQAVDGVRLVAGGRATVPAMELAVDCAATVRSLVLVDPPEPDVGELTALARELGIENMPVQLVVSSAERRTVRPLPLGHPEVVSAVVQTVAVVESEAAAVRLPDAALPEQRSLLLDAVDAVLTMAHTALTGSGTGDR
jgi:hypothetical protein